MAIVAAALPFAAADEDGAFFEKKVRPLLAEHCYDCHSDAGKVKGGLRLDSPATLLKGGQSGRLFTPGHPEQSLLIKVVRHDDPDLQMPPKKKLPAEDIESLTAWIRNGARMPVVGQAGNAPDPLELARTNWAFRAPSIPTVPAGSNEWAISPVDRFILAHLERLTPAPRADRKTLIRRAAYDLTGLPPTPEEVAAFENDAAPDAFARLIDRLLASPRYGEKWARHWLDVVRYTDSLDSRGIGSEGDIAEAWRYRDWVVDAFNRDLPYDEFIIRQVAGDILATNVPGRLDTNALIATGVYVIGEWGTGDADKEKMLTDIVDDQIDLTGRGFLGLTLACARCHDHKFDPISAADYYGLAGIFFSSHILPNPGVKTAGSPVLRLPLSSPRDREQRRASEERLASLEKELAGTTGPVPLTRVGRSVPEQPGVAFVHPPDRDLPNGVANAAGAPARFSTITMPPRSVGIHPSPDQHAALVWKSPLQGEIEVRGRVADADDKCGNGAEWKLSLGSNTVLRGTFDNGGEQVIAPTNLLVAAGQLVTLTVRARGRDHSCDTTVVELQVKERNGERVWRVPEDIVSDLPRLINTGAWHMVAYSGQSPATLMPDLSEDAQRRIEAARREVATLRAALDRKLPVAHGFQEGGTPQSPYAGFKDSFLLMRGRYDRPGEVVPRRFPKLLAGDDQPKLGTNTSGRMELARWIASKDNPLTARVMMNRIWQHHFGEGIVRTPNNFGKLGTPPTHPELLDWLAHRFVESKWSIKAMHRLIMNSAAYQQTSAAPESVKVDPDNLLLARMTRRRLTAEELRDSMMLVSGQLEQNMGGPAINDLNTRRRTLYVMTVRSDKSNYRSLFDAPDAQTIAERRTESTVAPQALFLLNSPFVSTQARALAKRIAALEGDDASRVNFLHQLLYSRKPTARELELGVAAVRHGAPMAWEHYCHVLLCANEFVFVD